MTTAAYLPVQTSDAIGGVRMPTLQRACACGGAAGVSERCESCEEESRLGLQPKLTVNAPGDRYEQEADRIADWITTGAGPTARPLAVTPLVQRTPAPEERDEEDEEPLQTKPAIAQRQAEEEEEEEGEAAVQARRAAGPTPTPGPFFASALATERTGGSMLSPASRAFFEPRFGRDLSSVRIHQTARAADLSRRINARAFTYGRHIFLGAGQADERSTEGRRLLAHELTHTLQQSATWRERQVQRRNIFEEFAGLFRSDDFDDAELRRYLRLLTTERRIEDYTDSDNKARAVVNRLRHGDDLLGFDDTAMLRILLIREMQSGHTGGPDERAILYLLERAGETQLNEMFAPGALTVPSLRSDFQGAEHRQLERFFNMRFEGGLAAVERGEVRALPRRTPHESMVVYRARIRLARLQEQLARAIRVEAQRTRTLQDRRDLDRSPEMLLAGTREPEERRLASLLNLRPLRIELSPRRVVFRVNLHVRFEDPSMRGRRSELERSIRRGLAIVWNHRLTDETFGGRDFAVETAIREVGMTAPRDDNAWLITVRPTDQTAPTFPGCTFPALPATPTSVTLADCGDGVVSIPPLHVARPGVLGHEMLHLFGLIDRYRLMEFQNAGGQVTGHRLDPLRETRGRTDPLGGEEGTILQEDLAYIFNTVGLYEQEIQRQTGGRSVAALRAQIAREEEIIRLGRDPHSLIRPREHFNEELRRTADDI